ncbi:MAG: porin [Rhodospirillales bacterium]|tara:strand:- start:2911 stop:4086 length:1176 start_codon:yes stop_codon:yes gene_type:complete
MWKPLTLLAALGAATSPAIAQEDWDVWETKSEAEGAIAASTSEGAPVALLGAFGISTNRVLDSGLEIGAVGRFEVQHDNPARAGFSGIPEGFGGVTGGWQSGFSGLAATSQREHVGTRGQLEVAYVYAEGGYGEVRLGRDKGVAVRFHEGAPSVFLKAGTANPVLDPTGQAYIRSDHDLTGPALKASYESPRILGVRAGVSFTPTADVRGVDRDPARRVAGSPQLSIESAAEASLNLSRRLRESGVRLQAALAYSRADVSAAVTPDIYGTIETWSAGASAEFDTITVGASVLGSNNGVENGSADYSAWTIGVTKQAFSFDFGLDYGEATDDLTGLESESWSLGVAKEIREGVRVAAGYRDQTARQRRVGLVSVPMERDSAEGVVLEITLSL